MVKEAFRKMKMNRTGIILVLSGLFLFVPLFRFAYSYYVCPYCQTTTEWEDVCFGGACDYTWGYDTLGCCPGAQYDPEINYGQCNNPITLGLVSKWELSGTCTNPYTADCKARYEYERDGELYICVNNSWSKKMYHNCGFDTFVEDVWLSYPQCKSQ